MSRPTDCSRTRHASPNQRHTHANTKTQLISALSQQRNTRWLIKPLFPTQFSLAAYCSKALSTLCFVQCALTSYQSKHCLIYRCCHDVVTAHHALLKLTLRLSILISRSNHCQSQVMHAESRWYLAIARGSSQSCNEAISIILCLQC